MLRLISCLFLVTVLCLNSAGCQLLGKHEDATTQASATVANAVERNASAVAPVEPVIASVVRGLDYPSTATLIGYGKFETLVTSTPSAGVMYVVDDTSGKIAWAMYVPEAISSATRLSDGPPEFKAMFDREKYYRVYFQTIDKAPATQPVVR